MPAPIVPQTCGRWYTRQSIRRDLLRRSATSSSSQKGTYQRPNRRLLSVQECPSGDPRNQRGPENQFNPAAGLPLPLAAGQSLNVFAQFRTPSPIVSFKHRSGRRTLQRLMNQFDRNFSTHHPWVDSFSGRTGNKSRSVSNQHRAAPDEARSAINAADRVDIKIDFFFRNIGRKMVAFEKVLKEPVKKRANRAPVFQQRADANADMALLRKYPAIALNAFVFEIHPEWETLTVKRIDLPGRKGNIGIGAKDIILRPPAVAYSHPHSHSAGRAIGPNQDTAGQFAAIGQNNSHAIPLFQEV